MDFPFCLAFSSDSVLLLLSEKIQHTAEEECPQHNNYNNKDILVDRPAFLLDGFQRHIADQIDRTTVDSPHIGQGIYTADIMVKQYILAVFDTLCNFCPNIFLHDFVCIVKILQIEMACIAFARAFGFQHETLAVCVHDIEHCPAVIKPDRQGFFKGIINIFHIKPCDPLPVPFDRAFHGICPGSHIIQI